MAQEFSFDVVSQVDLQEVDNAVNQAVKEIANRFDFRGSRSSLSFDRGKAEITLVADDEFKRKALHDVLVSRLVKRGVPPGAAVPGTPEASFDGTVRQVVALTRGIPSEKAKQIVKHLRDGKRKVQAAIQGDQVRVSGKSKDELQEAIAALRSEEFGVPLQFTNFR